ncbi:ion channel [Bacteroidota bacterium]
MEANENLNQIREISPITYTFERIFFYLQYVSIANLMFKTRTDIHNENINTSEEEFKNATKKRGRKIDYYVICCLLVEFTAVITVGLFCNIFDKIIIVICVYRVVDIFQSTINMNIFDHLRVSRKLHQTANTIRSLILSILNYIEIAFCFSIVYFINRDLLYGYSDKLSAIYFSIITQLTIGYGELHPLGYLRYIVVIHSIFGFLFAILILARLISFVPSVTSVFDKK